jgi:hypothetical protein
MSTSKQQYRREFKRTWDLVDAKYMAEELLGRLAAQTILVYSTRASHHDLPFALSVMAGLFSCTNGAKVAVFPGDASPLMLCVINVNYPQTRKSAMHGALGSVTSEMDAASKTRATANLREMTQAGSGTQVAADEADGSLGQVRGRGNVEARVNSATLTSFTDAAFFQHAAGDWDQVKDCDRHGLSGRVLFSLLVNLDEAYKFFRMLGLVGAASGNKGNEADKVGSDAASEFNRLMQTGKATYTTKTAGSFGEGAAPTISLGMTGNAHPSVVVPMERGEVGLNHVMAKERLLLVTARPIEPHAPISSRLVLPRDFNRWLWPKLLKCMTESLGLPTGVELEAVAKQKLKRARRSTERRNESDDETELDDTFEPDASGYVIELVDGTASHLRFRKISLGGQPIELVAEYRIANRAVPICPQKTLSRLAQRVLTYFERPHQEVPWSAGALLAHKGFSSCFNARCAVERDTGDAAEAARLGAAPWHLAMLGTALLLLELAVGEHDGTDAMRDHALAVQESHVLRAFDLLDLLLQMRRQWQEDVAEPIQGSADAASANAGVNAAGLRSITEAPNFGSLSSQYEPFHAAPADVDEVPPEEDAHSAENRGDLDSSRQQSAAGEGQRTIAAGRTGVVQVSPRMLLPDDPDLPRMDEGYGEGGVTVQDAQLGKVILSDRDVMKKTLQRGGPVVFADDICDSVGVQVPGTQGSKRKRQMLLRVHWQAVMEAGLSKYQIGRFVAAQDSARTDRPKKAHVQLFLPSMSAEAVQDRIEYHNILMNLCQLSWVTFAQAVKQRSERRSRGGVAAADDGAAGPSSLAAPQDAHGQQGIHEAVNGGGVGE